MDNSAGDQRLGICAPQRLQYFEAVFADGRRGGPVRAGAPGESRRGRGLKNAVAALQRSPMRDMRVIHRLGRAQAGSHTAVPALEVGRPLGAGASAEHRCHPEAKIRPTLSLPLLQRIIGKFKRFQ
jgi:hypothetical protein